MVTPTEEIRKLQGEVDTLINDAVGIYTPELGDKLSNRARRIGELKGGEK